MSKAKRSDTPVTTEDKFTSRRPEKKVQILNQRNELVSISDIAECWGVERSLVNSMAAKYADTGNVWGKDSLTRMADTAKEINNKVDKRSKEERQKGPTKFKHEIVWWRGEWAIKTVFENKESDGVQVFDSMEECLGAYPTFLEIKLEEATDPVRREQLKKKIEHTKNMVDMYNKFHIGGAVL